MCGKLGADGQCGAERCNGDQMVSLFCETFLVFCTRRFLAPRTDLFFLFFKKCIYLLTWSKGSIQAKRGFLFLEGWARPPWASQRKVYLGQRLDSAGPASWARHARAGAPAPPRAWLPYLSADWHRLCLGSLWRSSRRECRPLPSTPGPWFC